MTNDPGNSSIRSEFVESATATNLVNLNLSPDDFASSTSRSSASDSSSDRGLRDIIASSASTSGPSSILAGQSNDIPTHSRLDNASAPVMQLDEVSNFSHHQKRQPTARTRPPDSLPKMMKTILKKNHTIILLGLI